MREANVADASQIDFERLFDEHFDDVYAYITFRLAPQADAAADLAQDVFHRAMRSDARLRTGASARAWLIEIARNCVTDHLRSRVRRNHHVDRFSDLAGHEGVEEPGEERVDRALRVGQIIRELSDRFATVLEDKYILGLTVEQIAQRRGETAKAVESALSRARDAFRTAWRGIEAREEGASSCETLR